MHKLLTIMFATALVGFMAGTAMAQQTVACDGTESGGDGDVSCDPNGRNYAYRVVDTLAMTDLYIGTEDGNHSAYSLICMPSGWTMTLEENTGELHHSGELVKTAHGEVNSAGAGAACPFVIHFSGPAGLPGGDFSFGFNHIAPSHDVEWQTTDSAADWAEAVGGGLGPVHAPAAEGVPTVSQWGVVVMTLLILAAATVVLRRRRWLAPQA